MKIIIVFLVIISNLSIWSEDKFLKKEGDFRSYLLKSKWHEIDRMTTHIQTTGLSIFNDSYSIDDPFEAQPCEIGTQGKYKINEFTITFLPSKDKCYSGFPKINVCKLTFDSPHPFYSTAIECENGVQFHEINSLKTIGQKISIFDVQNIEIYRREFKVLTNLKRRRYPDRGSELIYCIDAMSGIWMKFIPKGALFHAHAKTSEKDTIDGVEDFWYYGYAEFSSFPGINTQIESLNKSGISCAIDGKFQKDISSKLYFNYWVFGAFLK